jgi:hypothetical protein
VSDHQPARARALFKQAMDLSMYAAPKLSKSMWLLDLHGHSEGSAATAVRWWFEEELGWKSGAAPWQQWAAAFETATTVRDPCRK